MKHHSAQGQLYWISPEAHLQCVDTPEESEQEALYATGPPVLSPSPTD